MGASPVNPTTMLRLVSRLRARCSRLASTSWTQARILDRRLEFDVGLGRGRPACEGTPHVANLRQNQRAWVTWYGASAYSTSSSSFVAQSRSSSRGGHLCLHCRNVAQAALGGGGDVRFTTTERCGPCSLSREPPRAAGLVVASGYDDVPSPQVTRSWRRGPRGRLRRLQT